MFYWIYDLPALWVIVLFEIVFVGVCWLGTLVLRPLVRSRLHGEPRLNDMLRHFCSISELSTACFSAY